MFTALGRVSHRNTHLFEGTYNFYVLDYVIILIGDAYEGVNVYDIKYNIVD